MPTRETEVRDLKVILTRDEKLEYGEKMAKECNILKRAENEKAETSAEINGRIKGHKAEIDKVAEVLAQGYEYRPVKCERVLDYDRGVLRVIRLDTGEIVQERELTERERQMSLHIAPPPTMGATPGATLDDGVPAVPDINPETEF